MNNPTQNPGAGAGPNIIANLPMLPEASVSIRCNQARQRKEAGDYLGMIDILCGVKNSVAQTTEINPQQGAISQQVFQNKLNQMFGPAPIGGKRRANRKNRKTRRR